MQARHWQFQAVVLAVPLAVAACIIVPVPKSEPSITHGQELDAAHIAQVVPGARKADVLALLGPPTVIWADRDIYGWNWGRADWLVVGAAYASDIIYNDVTVDHWFLVRFDAAGTVVRAGHVRVGLFENEGEILRRFGDQ